MPSPAIKRKRRQSEFHVTNVDIIAESFPGGSGKDESWKCRVGIVSPEL